MVFVFRTSRHYATALLRAKLRNSAIEHINLIKEIHGYGEREEQVLVTITWVASILLTVDGHPFVEILTIWQSDCVA